jgi:hypothetical protein
MEPDDGSLPWSEEPASGLCPEWDESVPQILFLLGLVNSRAILFLPSVFWAVCTCNHIGLRCVASLFGYSVLEQLGGLINFIHVVDEVSHLSYRRNLVVCDIP